MLPTLPLGSLFISELIGKEVILETYHGINSSLSSIQSFNLESVNLVLERLDISKKIEIVNSLFDERDEALDKTLVLALNNLHEISEKIEKELVEIKKDIEYSKTLYFSYLRSKPYFEKLKKLETHSQILDSRLDLFLRLID
jgi:hypothetical protein